MSPDTRQPVAPVSGEPDVTPTPERAPYVAPAVTWLGRLDDLTLGGQGSLGDKGPGGKRFRN